MAFHVTIAAIRVTFWISKSCILVVSFFHSRMPHYDSNSIAPYEEKDFGEVYWQGTYERSSSFSIGDTSKCSFETQEEISRIWGVSTSRKKTGPRRGTPDNKTPEHIENIVLNIAQDLSLGPLSIAEKLLMSREYN